MYSKASKKSKGSQRSRSHTSQALKQHITPHNIGMHRQFNALQARMGYRGAMQYMQAMMTQPQSDKSVVQSDTLHPSEQSTQEKENKTGLPDNLKSGIESLSGYSMDDVKVHYNSDKSAQLQAHAYAQGNDIHLGRGQEKHLPHEAWHVVQQKQGKVKPSIQLRGQVKINDNTGLEKEADLMGEKALQMKAFDASYQNGLKQTVNTPVSVIQMVNIDVVKKIAMVLGIGTVTATAVYLGINDASVVNSLILGGLAAVGLYWGDIIYSIITKSGNEQPQEVGGVKIKEKIEENTYTKDQKKKPKISKDELAKRKAQSKADKQRSKDEKDAKAAKKADKKKRKRIAKAKITADQEKRAEANKRKKEEQIKKKEAERKAYEDAGQGLAITNKRMKKILNGVDTKFESMPESEHGTVRAVAKVLLLIPTEDAPPSEYWFSTPVFKSGRDELRLGEIRLEAIETRKFEAEGKVYENILAELKKISREMNYNSDSWIGRVHLSVTSGPCDQCRISRYKFIDKTGLEVDTEAGEATKNQILHAEHAQQAFKELTDRRYAVYGHTKAILTDGRYVTRHRDASPKRK